jgi:two-component system, cell cycle response regulator DivK
MTTGAPILVVDDAPVSLKLMRLLLTHEGYQVRTAERAEDALEMLSDYRPDLILADIQLPGMNGLEMTRQVKNNPKTSGIRVVALTACAMKDDREKAMLAGCEDYITKPIDTSTLASKVRELLAHGPAGRGAQNGTRLVDGGEARVSGVAMKELQDNYLDEGIERVKQLLDSLNGGLDPVRAAWQLHEWTGSAGLLGYPEISGLTRRAEQVVRVDPPDLAHLRIVLSDLLLTFSELRDRRIAPVPEYVSEAARGKRVALIGFNSERADEMCSTLERVKARPRLFEASDDPNSEAIRDCDLAIVHVRPETLECSWLQSGAAVPCLKRLVFAGDQRELAGLSADVRSRAVDFLVGRGDAEDVLLRLAFVFTRSAATAPAAPAVAVAAGATASVGGDGQPSSRPAVTRPNIVLADDDSIIRTLLGSTLQNRGMCCRIADNGRDALNLIRAEAPHVAVLDVNMPVLDGFGVLAAVRAEKIPTRIILLTSLQQEKDVLRAFSLGADDYVTKPFNPFEVVARVKRLIP